MKVCVVGAGAIGGMMAAKLANSGHQLSVIARGAHLEAIRSNGLKYIDKDGELVITDLFATAEMSEVTGQDLVLLGVKAHQIEPIADKLQAMLADANPQLLICADKSEIYAGELCVTPAELRVASALKDSSAVSVASADPAWLLYTSGSTGMPKGVIGQHATAVSRCRWMWQQFAFSQTDVFAQRTSLNFVDSIWEIFGALLHGARVEILPVELAADPAGMLDWLGKTRVTHLVVVPSLLWSSTFHFPSTVS